MRYLVLVRHGNHIPEEGGILSLMGRESAEMLGKVLMRRFAGQKCSVISSTRVRATQTAEIISEELLEYFISHEVLWSDATRREDLPRATTLMAMHGSLYDVVVAVTHYEYTETWPKYIAEHLLHMPPVEVQRFPERPLDNCMAYVIDLEQKTCEHVSFM